MNYIDKAIGRAMDELGMAHGGLHYRICGDGSTRMQFIEKGGRTITRITPFFEGDDMDKAEKAKAAINVAKEYLIEAMQLMEGLDLEFS